MKSKPLLQKIIDSLNSQINYVNELHVKFDGLSDDQIFKTIEILKNFNFINDTDIINLKNNWINKTQLLESIDCETAKNKINEIANINIETVINKIVEQLKKETGFDKFVETKFAEIDFNKLIMEKLNEFDFENRVEQFLESWGIEKIRTLVDERIIGHTKLLVPQKQLSFQNNFEKLRFGEWCEDNKYYMIQIKKQIHWFEQYKSFATLLPCNIVFKWSNYKVIQQLPFVRHSEFDVKWINLVCEYRLGTNVIKAQSDKYYEFFLDKHDNVEVYRYTGKAVDDSVENPNYLLPLYCGYFNA